MTRYSLSIFLSALTYLQFSIAPLPHYDGETALSVRSIDRLESTRPALMIDLNLPCAESLQDSPDQNLHQNHDGLDGLHLLANKTMDIYLALGKRLGREETESPQQKQANISRENPLGVELGAGNYEERRRAKEPVEILSRSQNTQRSIDLGNSIFVKRNYPGKMFDYANLFLHLNEQASLISIGITIRDGENFKVPDFPIMLIRAAYRSSVLIRLIEVNGTRKGKCRRILSSQRRVQALLTAVDFFHDVISSQGSLQKSYLGINEKFHQELIKWLESVLFHRTEKSLPLLGVVVMPEELPENVKELFDLPQLYLSTFLSGDYMSDAKVVDTALSSIIKKFVQIESWIKISTRCIGVWLEKNCKLISLGSLIERGKSLVGLEPVMMVQKTQNEYITSEFFF